MKSVITFLSYAGTLGAGVAIGVFCTRGYFEKRETERADREIESMKDVLRKNEESEKVEDDVRVGYISEGKTDVATSFQYHTFSKPDLADRERPRDEDEDKKPYFIDIDDFDEPTLGYAKKELLYYMEDGTLVDESENMDEEGQVVNIVDTVGVTNLESFENSLESCCYIRNEALKEDYEISKVFGSYGKLLDE